LVVIFAAGALIVWTLLQRRPDISRSVEVISRYRNKVHRIRLAGLKIEIPTAPVFSIHVSDGIQRNSYHLEIADDAERLCERAKDRATDVSAVAVGFKFQDVFRLWMPWKIACLIGSCGWPKVIREIVVQGARGYRGNLEYPVRARIFALDSAGRPPQGFELLTANTYADFLAGCPITTEKRHRLDNRRWTYEPSLNRTTPDGNPFTTAWYRVPNGLANCHATYHWRDGAHIHLTFQSQPYEIEHTSRVVDDNFRTLLDTLAR
jgi:hypothetical protein